ncbi:MAG TPA: M48 family metalloprotease [Candidatus Sulfotelmatobacter sp.]|nr:M48 family metalloprotease [Candidatus Sulfotelmatobacter sp.]
MPVPAVTIRPRRSMILVALFSIAMVVLSYVFVLALAAACVLLPYWMMTSTESANGQLVLLFLFGIAIAGAMLWSLVPRLDKFKAPGPVLDKSQHPFLFAELENIAGALNEPMPREVYLIGDLNAWVADRGGFMGFGSRRVMGLGLPLLSILTISQFRAVLAHEFAHYYGGDTSLGPWVYKTQNAMVRIFQNIGSVGKVARVAVLSIMYMIVGTLMKWYFKLFLRAINLASRQREYRADELACLVAGRQALVDGLRSIHGGTPAWPVYWQTEVAPILGQGAAPSIAEGFAQFTAVPHIHQQIQTYLVTQIRDAKTNPYDSHPPLRERIAAAEKVESQIVTQDTRSAISLLDQPQLTELRFLEHVNPDMKPGMLASVSWDDVAARVTVPGWKKFAEEYSSVLQGISVESLPGVVPKLQQIGNGMRDPKGMLLGPEQRFQRASYLIGVGFALALLDLGWTLRHTPGVFHLSRAAATLSPFEVMDKLVKGQLTAADWSKQCAELEISGLQLGPVSPQQLQLSIPGTV